MKWESSDFAVGAVVITGTLILLASLLWLSGGSRNTYPLYTHFDRIDGISAQANVVLRGYNVGTVEAIEPIADRDGSLRFRVRLEMKSRLASGDTLRLPSGTVARLMPPPVIGAGFIVLEPPLSGGAPLEPGSTIPGVRSTAIVEQMQGLTGEMSGEVVETMVTARELMDSLTSAIVIANRALLQTTSAIPPLVVGLEAQLAAARGLTEDLRSHLNTLGPATVANLDSVTLLLSDSRELVSDLRGMLNTTQPEMTSILAHLDSTTMLLNHFVLQFSQKPISTMLKGTKPPAGLFPPPPGDAISGGSAGDTVPERFRAPGASRPETDTIPGS